MKTQSVVKGTLLALGMTGISAGMTLLGGKDLYGLVLIAVGFGVIYLREKLKIS